MNNTKTELAKKIAEYMYNSNRCEEELAHIYATAASMENLIDEAEEIGLKFDKEAAAKAAEEEESGNYIVLDLWGEPVILLGEDGEPATFCTRKEAQEYGNKEAQEGLVVKIA